MARIAGVDIPREKRVVISLTYIYGIGLKTAQQVLKQANVSEDTRVKDLSNDELDRIREIIDGLKVEGEIGSYRGLRHRRGLPVRGQNTKNNARTRKGPKKMVTGKK